MTSRIGRVGSVLVAVLMLVGCRKNPPDNASKTPPVVAQEDPFTYPPSFRRATRRPYHKLPEDAETITGKPLTGLMRNVLAMWDKIPFRSPDGKRAIRYRATLKTDVGDIQLGFYPDEAPNHCRSFVALAKVGYYDGLLFHRISHSDGLKVIQGGCPLGNGQGGPGYCLKPEFNQHKHVTGAMSAARAAPHDSAGSQFFICSGSNPFLDRKENPYTVFGYVIAGQDVVDKIAKAPVTGMNRDKPAEPVRIRQVIIEQQETALSAGSQRDR